MPCVNMHGTFEDYIRGFTIELFVQARGEGGGREKRKGGKEKRKERRKEKKKKEEERKKKEEKEGVSRSEQT